MVEPVPFLKLFRYASREDLIMICIGNLFILYSSLNIPLVNIVYGLMMREMNEFVARRSAHELLTPLSSPLIDVGFTGNTTATTTTIIITTTTTSPPSDLAHNGTMEEAEQLFINNSYNLCMTVILFGATRFVALYIALLFFSLAASNQAKRVKKLFFSSLLRQEIAWFERNRTGDFAIRITSDLSKFEDGIGEKIALCLNALFAWMSSLISSFYYGWELTLVCLVLVPLTIFTTTCIAQFQATYSIKESAALSRAFNVCHEAISSIRTVLSFSGQQKEAERFKQGLDSAYKHGLKRNMFAALNLGFTWMSGYLGFAICLLYSTKFYQPHYLGKYDEAHIVTILWSAAGCVFLLNRMMPFIEIIQMARGSAANIFSVIERKSLIDVTSEHGLKPKNFEANVVFEQVSFAYPNTSDLDISFEEPPTPQQTSGTSYQPTEPTQRTKSRVLDGEPKECTGEPNMTESQEEKTGLEREQRQEQAAQEEQPEQHPHQQQHGPMLPPATPTIRNMSMEIKSGQTIALVGPSGSGKSTALALLQRFYDIDSGAITLGGHKLSELNLAWLRGQFGVVTQEPVLFDMSIADNIKLGGHPGQVFSDYDVEQAARSANAHAFIVRLPQGYETRVGTRGVQLSGGQKQRISIARALIRQPKILLLDEATSALDLESESIVQRALDQARVGRTTFIVAHRLSTVRNADKIIVFDKGTIAEWGTHDELVKKRGLYYQIGSQQRQGIDLVPSQPHHSHSHTHSHNVARRNSHSIGGLALYPSPNVAPSTLSTHPTPALSGHGNNQQQQAMIMSSDHQHAFGAGGTNRESRSLSIYSSTTGKYTATSGFGAAGHGGNGEGVDSGSCCCVGDDEPAGNRFATDDDYYGKLDQDEDESDTSAAGQSQLLLQAQLIADGANNSSMGGGPCLQQPLLGAASELADDATQASFLEDSFRSLLTLQGTKSALTAGGVGCRSSTQSHINAGGTRDCLFSRRGGSAGPGGASLSVFAVLRFIKPNVLFSLIGILASLLMGLCIPISAMIIGNIATQFSLAEPERIRAGLLSHGLLYIGLALFAFCVSFIQVVSFGIAGEKIGLRLRLRVFEAILNHEMSWFDKKRNNPGSICGRLASDVGNVQSITGNRTAVIFQSISILVSTFVFALYFNLKFSAICAMFVAILLASTIMQSRYAAKLAIRNRGFDSQIGKIVLESSANIKTVVSLHQEGYFIERCEMLLERDKRSRSLDNHLRLSLESLKYAMTAISKGSSFYFAARMLLHNEITIDVVFKLIEIILYGLTEASKSLIFISDLEKARRGTQNLYKLVNGAPPANYSPKSPSHSKQQAIKTINNSRASPTFASKATKLFKRLVFDYDDNQAEYQQLKASDEAQDEAQDVPALQIIPAPNMTPQQQNQNAKCADHDKKARGDIKFCQVKFHYPARPDACVLKALSLEIAAGKSVALVGRSGCGKSTVVQILQRFYAYSSGQVFLDNIELQSLPSEFVRSQIALVSQEPSLLSYTIGDNIRYGDNSRYVPMDEIVHAAQVANIHDFIMSLPDQYDTQLSEANSLQLSGGQKQRIAIARALVRKAPILILDEATSALDVKSESLVQEALERAQVGKTSIVIAHRLSTVRKADSIVVLKDGLVVEQGTHQELLDRRGEYYCLYKTQASHQ